MSARCFRRPATSASYTADQLKLTGHRRSASSAASKATATSRSHRVAGIEHARPGDLTFFANPKYARAAARDARVGGDPGDAGGRRAVRDAAEPPIRIWRSRSAVELFAAARRRAAGRRTGSPHVAPTASVARRRVDRPVRQRSATGARIGARTDRLSARRRSAPARAIGDDCVIHARVSIRERVARQPRRDPGRRGDRQRRLRLRAPRRTARTTRSRRSAAS